MKTPKFTHHIILKITIPNDSEWKNKKVFKEDQNLAFKKFEDDVQFDDMNMKSDNTFDFDSDERRENYENEYAVESNRGEGQGKGGKGQPGKLDI